MKGNFYFFSRSKQHYKNWLTSQQSILSTMISGLKQKLKNDSSPQLILSWIAQPAFLHNLSLADLKQLTKIVQSPSIWKLHPKVMTTIYSIIVMKDQSKSMINTKTAIEALTKYYRSLSQCENVQSTRKSRQVISVLLLRIPTFSNYKLVIKDLTPQLVPLSLMLQHCENMKKQCPNLYDEYIIQRYKHIWVELIAKGSSMYPIQRQFTNLAQINNKIRQAEFQGTHPISMLELNELGEQLKKQAVFMQKRVMLIQRQNIDLEKLCAQVDDIMDGSSEKRNNQKGRMDDLLLPMEFKATKDTLIRNCKEYTIQILGVLLEKCKTSFYRKVHWLNTVFIKKVLTQNFTQTSLGLIFILKFMIKILNIYGLGIYQFDAFLYSQPHSIHKLLQALCYNDYSRNQHDKNQQQQINYQKNQKSRQKNLIQLNLHQGTLIQTHFEEYLRTTIQREREQLLTQCLEFCINFYQKKKQSSYDDFMHASDILSVVRNSKNKISQKNQDKVQKLEKVLFGEFYGATSNGFEGFCERVFHDYIKKKTTKSLEKERAYQLIIEPSKKIKPNIQEIPQKSNPQLDTFKRTQSFDINYEGWKAEKPVSKSNPPNRPSPRNEQKSQIFYSIKQCSEEELRNKKEEQQQEQEGGFILTPEF